jgi:dipeptidyl aminopeptidase/acylaminoacyl peptidase
MQKDFRQTAQYAEAEDLCRALRRPGTGEICDAAEACASPAGHHAVFSATIVDKLDGTVPTRICSIELATGDIRVLTFGPNTDRSPKYSPDGRYIAFLSDRGKAGDFQLYLLDCQSGSAHATPVVDGWVEYIQWSPDGTKVLLGVAGHGADVAGGQGAVTSKQQTLEIPSWMPRVESGDEAYRWRSAWTYDVATDRSRRLSPSDCTVWEAAWCGNGALVAVTSPGPGEGLWYSATLKLFDVSSGSALSLYSSRAQVGWPSASPRGDTVAVVEAICSDRWYVAGDLLLIDTATGNVKRVDTLEVDVAHTEWRSETRLLVGGHRACETVVGLFDTESEEFTEIWSSQDTTTGGQYVKLSGIGAQGDCVMVGEGFVRPPEIAIIRGGQYSPVRSFAPRNIQFGNIVESIKHIRWNAPDGLEIHGWLLLPFGKAPHPLIMNIHGGPVWQWRPTWLGRGRSPSILMLLKRGYAIFFPNPRGSSGRGQEFARRVLGDMGGADTRDLTSGLDYLIGEGVADPARLGVTGGSYGGFMTSWLITQDSRFAAAVPFSPVTNQVTEQLLSNIPHFVTLFLDDSYTNLGGKHFQRSPVVYANRAKTPTLNVCGALDRCTPAEEAEQFHNALLENGVKSVLVVYPEEGHGVRKFPACFDYAARVVSWFEEHMPSDTAQH